MRIIYMGTPEIAVAPLQHLHAAGRTIVGVVTQPDRPARRRKELAPPPVKVAAQALGIPVLQPETLKDAAAVAWLRELQPDVGIVAAYGEILRRDVLDIPAGGYLNIHPSILPLYRGPAPVTGAILAGDDLTGVSIIRLTRKMDAGPLVAQVVQPLKPDARAGTLTAELMEQGGVLLNQVIDQYMNGTLQPQAQDASQATYTELLAKEAGCIDWTLPALIIERMTRAYDPWPSAFTTVDGQQLKLLEAQVEPGWSGTAAAGTLIDSQQALVATGSGALQLVTVQPAGKRAMSAADWLRGARGVQQLGT